MKIAVFSDIHGNKEVLKAILQDIKENKIDEVYSLGDTIGIGPNSKECLDMIIDNNIKMVLGNHELYYLYGTDINNVSSGEIKHHLWLKDLLGEKYKKFLSKCEIKIDTVINGKTITYEHFLLNNNSKFPFENIKIVKKDMTGVVLSSDITYIGHEHKSFDKYILDKRLIDVGSSGCVKNDITFYTMLDTNKMEISKKFIKFDREAFVNSFKNIEYPEKEEIGKIFFGIGD